jgi:hypothetical protein
MSTEALNRIMKEVNELTPQERLDLINRLANSTHEGEITTDNATLREWLNEARNMRAELPLTSDSVDMLKKLREVRSRQ